VADLKSFAAVRITVAAMPWRIEEARPRGILPIPGSAATHFMTAAAAPSSYPQLA
jgi:hypothetical protein